MRISDWSSDVCSSDLYGVPLLDGQGKPIRKASVDADDAASSAEAVPEPAGYRTENYRAAVPAGLTGARTVDVEGLRALIAKEDPLLVDVMPTQPKPANRRADAIWRDPQRETIKGAVWLAERTSVGSGKGGAGRVEHGGGRNIK